MSLSTDRIVQDAAGQPGTELSSLPTVLAVADVFESVFTRAVVAGLVFLSLVAAWKSEKVREGAKLYLGIVTVLVVVVVAYAVGYTVGAASEGGQQP